MSGKYVHAHAARARPRSRLRPFRHRCISGSQRLTSVALIPLTIAFVLIVISLLGRNHAAAVQILGSPLVAIIMLLFIVHRRAITCGSACRSSSRITCTTKTAEDPAA